jgi:C1A family cysteine protease
MAKIGGWVLPNRRAAGWLPDVPDHRDQLFKGLKPRKAITEKVALKEEFLPPIGDQGNLGSCTGWAIRACLLYSLRQQGEVFRKPGYGLSALFAYYQARLLDNSVNEDSGAYIRNVVKGAFNVGVATEASWPYKIERFAHKPSATAEKTARWHQVKGGYKRCLDVDDILQAISYDTPVAGGFSWFSNSDGPNGHMPMPGPRDSLEGGHAICIVGGDPKTREFKFSNSWSDKWGDDGYGYVPFAFMERGWMDDCWAVLHE